MWTISLEKWVALLVLLGQITSLQSPTLEIPIQPCVGSLEGRGKARGLCVVKGDLNSLGFIG